MSDQHTPDRHTPDRHTSGRHAVDRYPSASVGHALVSDRHIRYRLARYRLHRGLTQKQVADRVGVTREYMSMLENGRRRANSYRLLTALAGALGVDVTALTTHQPGGVGDPPEQAVTLRLALPNLAATVEATEGGRGIVLTDGVLRIELIPGPADSAKQNRNGALDIVNAVCAYLRGTPPDGDEEPGERAGRDEARIPVPPAGAAMPRIPARPRRRLRDGYISTGRPHG